LISFQDFPSSYKRRTRASVSGEERRFVVLGGPKEIPAASRGPAHGDVRAADLLADTPEGCAVLIALEDVLLVVGCEPGCHISGIRKVASITGH
jgi:hypothetical protein